MPPVDRRDLKKRMMSDAGQEVDFSDPEQRVKFFWDYATRNRHEYFDRTIVDYLKLIEVRVDKNDPNVAYSTFELTVDRSLCNVGENLHGGAVALIFDITTSVTVAAVAREGFWDQGHVSRALNCTYLRPAPVGSVLLVENEVVHLGKSMGNLRGVMRRKEDGKVCYKCDHDKAQVVFGRGKL